jgi:hypothetical protein
VGITVGALNAPLALVALIPAWLTGVYFTARHFYKKTTARRTVELENLLERLAQLTGEIIASGGSVALKR